MHNKFNDVEFDPRKERENLRKHRVSFTQAEQALYDELAITAEDTRIVHERRFSTLGSDASGRVLIVIHTPRGTRTRLISARKASKGEAEQYYAQRL